MLSKIFPPQFDNGTYRGHRSAIWILMLISVLKSVQGVESMLRARETMQSADGIPLQDYTAAAGNTMVMLFALLGMNLLILPALSTVALIRYRAMIPLLYLLYLVTYAAGRLVHVAYATPPAPATSAIAFAGHPIGFYVNLAIVVLMAVGLCLSVWRRSSI